MFQVMLFALVVFQEPVEFTAQVVGVSDGDTITVLRDRQQIKVRLVEIDAPESSQAFGQRAKQATSALCFAKTVTVRVKGKDRYDRTLAQILLPDGRNLNRELVATGYAWWYRDYSKDKSMGQLEAVAKEKRLGLWADPNPVPPWEFRKTPKEKATPNPANPIAASVGPNTGIRITALMPNPAGEDAGAETVTLTNASATEILLDGWMLEDAAKNTFRLSGTILAGQKVTLLMRSNSMPLNNDGDTVTLLDGRGGVRHRVSYQKAEVQSGKEMRFE